MKKFLCLALSALALCASCSDNGGKSVDKRERIYSVPSESEMTSIAKSVADASAKAEPGSKDFCNMLSDILEDFDAINFGAANYDDEDLDNQAKVIDNILGNCLGSYASDFSWYLEGQKSAVNSCDIPSGIDVQGYMSAIEKLLKEYTTPGKDCSTFIAGLTDIHIKYQATAIFVDMYSEAADECITDNCPAEKCLNDWTSKYISDPQVIVSAGMNLSTCMMEEFGHSDEGFFSYDDPCDTKICGDSQLCVDGDCVGLCSLTDCGSGTSCYMGFCVPNGSGYGKGNGGNGGSLECSDYPKAKAAAFNAVNGFNAANSDCRTLIADYVKIVEGVKKDNPALTDEEDIEDLIDDCSEEWIEGISILKYSAYEEAWEDCAYEMDDF